MADSEEREAPTSKKRNHEALSQAHIHTHSHSRVKKPCLHVPDEEGYNWPDICMDEPPLPTSSDHCEALWVVPRDLIVKAIDNRDWTSVAAYHRVNALTCCKSAEHGWLGGSFSCIELLSALTLDCKASNVILAKGHAAAAQYAVLYAEGKIEADQLKRYKHGHTGLEAHADIQMDTGSLGQCLSTAAGMCSVSSDSETFAVVLGDGEMQEGQIYESIMTMKKYNLSNIVSFIDVNGYQSDNPTDDIMPIDNLAAVLQGFGCCVHSIDGHDHEAIVNAWNASRANGLINFVIARTTKAGGTSQLQARVHQETGLKWMPWHTKVPDWHLYVTLIKEQLGKVNKNMEVIAQFENHLQKKIMPKITQLPNTHRPALGGKGTGKAFGNRLVELMENPVSEAHRMLSLVDADLATSCGINRAVPWGPPKYFELGVAEQDAASFAAGLALRGRIPVLNTYSNFLKRCFENIFISILEGAPMIIAGHYSGLCYHTDGKSHQSFDDLSVFSSLHPSLLVVDPATPKQAIALLEELLSGSNLERSVYFRLRRTPAPELFCMLDEIAADKYTFDTPLFIPPKENEGTDVGFVTIGTVATKLAWDCQNLESFKRSPVAVVAALNHQFDHQWWYNFLKKFKYIIVIEDDVGALFKFVCRLVNRLLQVKHVSRPKVVSHPVLQHGPSQRTLDSCLKHFGFVPKAVEMRYLVAQR